MSTTPPDAVDPATELVALYDPRDPAGRVTGRAPRREVRTRNLPHAATGVLLRDDRGRVLVHRRTTAKDLNPGAHDCLAGGVVDAGETPLAAAHRELREELGLDVDPGTGLRPVLVRWYRDETAHYLAHVYEARWDGTPLVLQPSEVADAWWEETSTLRRRLLDSTWSFVPDTRELLAHWPEWWKDPARP
ncbi:NUDIX domain-containing protein [Kineococcus aurantiacus]|uniref:8-oxo-dGTP pyrophosphatase MutT (NUDIX family) n=1 Tax=Kineococcus aurantiacus TaxID=37633 RepID=A0A7Y9ARW2_9ACTN|nr:8-oxo-dGTP pyrophosphatase MutT (NUDIX family) [Kineococcus aurantiacus]